MAIKAVDPRVLEMLVCPLTKTRLTFRPDNNELISRAARIAFPIREGVPMLCLEESRYLTDDELTAIEG